MAVTTPTRLTPAQLEARLQQAIAQQLVGPETPSAIFHDFGMLAARYQALTRAFPANTLHAVAIKANPLVPILRWFVAQGAGLEAASREEVALALAAGCTPERIVYDSPAKTVDDLAFALGQGIRLNADNPGELARIAELRATIPSTSPVGVRVNPLTGEGTIAATSVATRRSQFGMPLTGPGDPGLHRAFEQYEWLTGLHVHVGSQGCSLAMLVSAIAAVNDLRHAIDRRLGARRVTSVDIGGGLPVAYTEADQPPTAHAYAEALRSALPDLFNDGPTLITEFGRHMLANAGWAATRVEYTKTFEDQAFAIGHLGADFMLRRAYRPDNWPLELLVLDPAGRLKPGDTRSPWTIAGPLCFSGDIMARDRLLPPIAPGDWLIFRDVGAYTLSMWNRHCSRGIPAVYGHDGADRPFTLLRPAETPEDIVRFWGG